MAKKNFYSVVSGYNAGIYEDWKTCEKNIKGFSNAKYKGFSHFEDAVTWYKENGGNISCLPKQYIEKIFGESPKAISSYNSQSELNDDFENFFVKYGFENLNTVQKNAVQTVNGKTLLFAVPGSGKTTVIIARVGYLLYGQKDLSITSDMLVNLTFTRAAATEMVERYTKKFSKAESSEIPIFKTIHSFCWNEIIPELQLRNFPMSQNLINTDPQENFKIMHSDTDDFSPQKSIRNTIYSILKSVLKHFKLPFKDDTVREKIIYAITTIKNRQIMYEEYKDKVITVKSTPYSVAKIFDTYQSELQKRQCMDYDDILIYSLEGLKKYPEVLEKIQNKYFYWSIDEAQDNSRLQNELISLLAGDKGNLFIVGDDDQSIYSFRGAEPKLFLEYKNAASVKTMVMNINYRSGKNIVDVAKNFIDKNIFREPKETIANEKYDLGRINFFTALPTVAHQYRHILKRAANCILNGKSLAVIYRWNISSFPIMFWLKKYGINFNVKKDYQEIVYGKVFRDVISLMTFATDLSDFDAFKNCRYTLKIYLKNEHLESYIKLVEQHIFVENMLNWAVEVQPDLKTYIEKAQRHLQEISSKTPFEAVKYILQNLISSEENSAVNRLRNYALLAACIPYKTIKEFLDIHFELLEYAKRDNSNMEPVTLTSMHSVKGLEFDNVIIIDSLENIINMPFIKNTDELDYSDEEEERRLFYVAMTRAKKILDICVVENYFGNVEYPSEFITELVQCYEIVLNKSVQELPINPVSKTFSEFKFQCPKIYYGVLVGRKSGVFDNWLEVESSVKNYKGSTYKRFTSLEEAEQYVYGETKTHTQLNFQTLQSILQSVQSVSFIRSIDLPVSFNDAVLDWFNVSSLKELRGQRLSKLKFQTISYTDNQETIYHGRVDYYILVYMLVNFYKVWAPLWDLLRQRYIGNSLKILELGAGPGTSMISLINFYQLLATDNPKQQFTLNYNVVEREEDFINACESLLKKFMASSEFPNLKINWNIIKEDIYCFAENSTDNQKYDLILESNVLNGNENLLQEKTDKLIFSLADKLADEGSLILIEPGKNINVEELTRIGYSLTECKNFSCRIKPRKIKVLVDKIELLKIVKDLGLRSDNRDEHWFSYTIFGRTENK